MKQTVARWHPWCDTPGMRHMLTLWNDDSIWQNSISHFDPENVQDLLSFMSKEQLYTFCGDIMDHNEFLWSDDILLHHSTEAYTQKTGKVSAVKVQTGRAAGFFIPARSWQYPYPSFEMLETIGEIFRLFNFEAITPASLSEKVLRSTLGEWVNIFRPSKALRAVLLENNKGGRIDILEQGLYPKGFKYDQTKSYLFYARSVVSPYHSPVFHYKPDSSHFELDTPGYWHVRLIAHGTGLHPITIDTPEGKRFPHEGEEFSTWMWKTTLDLCIAKGYTLLAVHAGYRWEGTSDFLCNWTDILWEKHESVSDEDQKKIIKTMMVGLPGRFLREPINHRLIPESQHQAGDTPITANWFHSPENWQTHQDTPFFTNWYLRPEYHLESTALTPVGAYIINQCRDDMYRKAIAEEKAGNKLLQIYIDCLVFKHQATTLDLGRLPGQFKEEAFKNIWFDLNRFIGERLEGNIDARMPALPALSPERQRLFEKYYQMTKPC